LVFLQKALQAALSPGLPGDTSLSVAFSRITNLFLTGVFLFDRTEKRLEKSSGGGPDTAALEIFFDSGFFAKKYHSRLLMGALWTPEETVFRLWAPTARAVSLILYQDGERSLPALIL
jgi:hypothetical protein